MSDDSIPQDDIDDIDILAAALECAEGTLERYPLADWEKEWLHGSKYKRDPEGYKRRTAKYRKAHPERIHARSLNYRSRDKRRKSQDVADDIQQIYRSQKGRCWWCNKSVGDDYHVDHRIPLSRGGTNDPRNLCISCAKCNIDKKDKLPHEWNGRLF